MKPIKFQASYLNPERFNKHKKYRELVKNQTKKRKIRIVPKSLKGKKILNMKQSKLEFAEPPPQRRKPNYEES